MFRDKLVVKDLVETRDQLDPLERKEMLESLVKQDLKDPRYIYADRN